jgi:hypothetical protein
VITNAPSTEELIEFVEQLRGLDFQIGTQQYISAQNLLIALAAHGQLLNETDRLRTCLAPIFCTSPEEQELFYEQFARWTTRRMLRREPFKSAGVPDKATPTEMPAQTLLGKLGLRFGRRRLAGTAVLITIIVVIVLSLRSRPPVMRTLSGTVSESTSREPIRNAHVSYVGIAVASDERGHFSLVYPTFSGTDRASVTHPDYQPAGVDLVASQDNSIEVSLARLTPSPSPTVNPNAQNRKTPDNRNGVTATPVQSPSPAQPSSVNIRPQAASWWLRFYYQHSKLIMLSIVSPPLLALAVWAFWRLSKRRQMEKWRRREQPKDADLLEVTRDRVVHNPGLRRVAQELRRHRLYGSTELDAAPTIDSTIRHGGMFNPVYGSRKKMPEYLILIDRASMRDQQACLEDQTVNLLEREGVIVDQYYFQGDPRLSRAPGGSSFLTLEDSAARHPDHYLIIFSDGQGFFDPLTGRPRVWIDLFSAWPERALLTPEVTAGYRESALENLDFRVLPSNEAGIKMLAEIIRTGGYRKKLSPQTARVFPGLIARGRPDRWLNEERPDAATTRKLCAQLQNYLGNRGFEWLSACAVYPSLLWDLTLYVGDALGRQTSPASEEKEDLLRALVRLPWFRLGTMPDWLRSQLIAKMPRAQEGKVRHLIEALLLTSLEQSHKGIPVEISIGKTEAEKKGTWWRFWLAQKKRVRAWRRETFLREFLRTEPSESPLQDYVLLAFLSGNRLAVALPRKLRKILFRNGHVVHGLRPATVCICAALLSSGGLAFMGALERSTSAHLAQTSSRGTVPTATPSELTRATPSPIQAATPTVTPTLRPTPASSPTLAGALGGTLTPTRPDLAGELLDALKPRSTSTSPTGPGPTASTSSEITLSSPIDPMAVSLTEEDLALIAATQSPQVQQRLKTDEAARQDFAKNIREVLAVGEAGWRAGIPDRLEIKRQMALMRSVVMAENYFKSVGNGSIPNNAVPDAEIEDFFKQPGNQAKFDQFIKDAIAANPQLAGNEIPAAQLKQVKQQLGQVLIGEQRGVQARIDGKREVQLQILMEQLRIIASTYAKESLISQMKASDPEIDAYLAAHPEFQLEITQTRDKAETVLKRLRAGENFAKLAREFSSDTSNKNKGGDLGWFKAGQMVPEFEKAAFALQTGQVSDVVETKFGFHIIKLEGRRIETLAGKKEEQIHARHILISTSAGNLMKSPRERATEAVEREKQQKVVDDTVMSSHTTVPKSFKTKAP